MIAVMIFYILGSIGVGVICYLITNRIIPSVLLAIICLISVPIYREITDKREKEKYAKLKQERVQEAHRRRNNLLQACKTESKMTVYQKIPAQSVIFIEDYEDYEPIPTKYTSQQETKEIRHQLNLLNQSCLEKVGFRGDSVCSEQYTWSITWMPSVYDSMIKKYAYTDFVYEVPPEDDSKTYHFTPYRFIVDDISSAEDRKRGVRRGKMLLKNLKTNQILSEYIGFEVIPYRADNGREYFALNCFSDDNGWKEYMKHNDVHRALRSGNDDVVFEYFFNHAVDKSKKVAKPKLKK